MSEVFTFSAWRMRLEGDHPSNKQIETILELCLNHKRTFMQLKTRSLIIFCIFYVNLDFRGYVWFKSR